MRHSTLRAFLTYVASHNLDLYHYDSGSIFLSGTLNEEIYMDIPTGFEKILKLIGRHDVDLTNKCLRLIKAIYGLKQAPREWYVDLRKTLLSLGLQQSSLDPCIYVKRVGDAEILVGVFVDDLAVVTNCQEFLDQLKKKLSEKYKLNNYGELKSFLGYEITRNRANKTIILTQKE